MKFLDSIPKKLRLPVGCGVFFILLLMFIAIQNKYISWLESRKLARIQAEEQIRNERSRKNREKLAALEAAKSPEQREAERLAREARIKASEKAEALAKLEKEKDEAKKHPKFLKLSKGTIRVGMLHDEFIKIVKPNDIVNQSQGEDPDHPGSLIIIKRCAVGKIAFYAHFARYSVPGPYCLISISDVVDF